MTIDSKGPPPRRIHDPLNPPEGVSKIYDGHLITGPSGAAVDEMIEAMKKAKAKEGRWPKNDREAMSVLANLFPSMRGVPGTKPWDVDELIAWCKTGAPTSGSGWAARFLLSVWSPATNWNDHGLPGAGRFDLMSAWDLLDEEHRRAIMTWLDAPFWP